MPRWSRPPERNTESWLKSFSTNPRLAVIECIADDLSFASGKLYAIDSDGNEQELERHPFLDFWENPNPLHEYSGAALWRLHEIYLMLKGEGYFIIERDEAGRPVELWPVPTHWVFMTPYLDHPYYTVKTTSGGILSVSVDDMFIMKDLNPYDPFMRGLGQAESVADEVETDEYASKFQKRFFFNDATPNLIVAMPKSTDEQRKRFRMEWLERFQGIFKSHGMATVNGEISVQKVGESMKDMDMIQGRLYLRDAVLEHFGVPREIMGITESSNRATSEAAQFIYAQNVLMPKLRRREEAINQQLVPMFGDNLRWRFDDIVPRNKEFSKQKAIDGWNAGIFTKDEARKLLDMPSTPAGGVYKTSFSDIFVRGNENPADVTRTLTNMQYGTPAPQQGALEAGAASNAVETTDAFGRKARELKAIRLSAVERSEDAAARECTAAFQIATMKYFREQAKRMNAALGGTRKADKTAWENIKTYIEDSGEVDMAAWSALRDDQKKALVDEFVGGLIDWPAEANILTKIYEPLWRKAYDVGAVQSQKLYGLRAIQRPELISTARLNGGQRIAGIEDTTKKTIGRIVADGIEHGDSTRTMTKSIMQEMGATESRAKLIAEQETMTSLSSGQYEMMTTAGATSKTWHHRAQKHPRATHVGLDGVTKGIDEWFDVGGVKMRFPRDPQAIGSNKDVARESIKCRCYITYGGF